MPDSHESQRVDDDDNEGRLSEAVRTEAVIRAEAENRAHDHLTPDQRLDAFAAIDLYVEAFLAGARFASAQRGATR